MDYAQAVARGRFLLKRSQDDQWELAALTYELLTTKQTTVRKWAADLGASPTYAFTLKAVHERFVVQSTEQTRGLTFNECFVLASMSRERADELLARAKKNGHSVTTEHHERRHRDPVKEARELLHDQRQARKILEDPKARDSIVRELDRRRRKGAPPAAAQPGDVQRFTGIRDEFYEFLGGVIDHKVPKPDRRRLKEISGELDNANGWLNSYLDSGDRSFQDVLDAILAGAEPEDVVLAEPPPKPRKRRDPVVDASPIDAADPAPEPEPVNGSEPRKRRGPTRRDDTTDASPGKRRAS
ncbi:MAG: hypothetical protein LC722_01775 [Actinobacteria bacterium]|nr:hypothetical protein [Actinomycetota bacterium]